MALLPNSPAINAGNSANAPADDQRGLSRFGNTDIGAFEYQFKVTNTNDTGLGALRQAILNSNATPGANTIVFKIPGAGVHTITPSDVGGVIGLPVITNSVTIDGWSEGGPGYTGPPLIEIDGTDGATDGALGSFGLNIQASNTTVRGLAINRFPGRERERVRDRGVHRGQQRVDLRQLHRHERRRQRGRRQRSGRDLDRRRRDRGTHRDKRGRYQRRR